ncbi:hypothetical protein Tco_0017508 [Tanacetum coccineum]
MHTAGLKSFARIREEMEKMRNYNPPRHESAPADPFLAVINKEYDGHRRLFGKGVTNTLIKKVNGDGSASTVPREIVKSPTRAMFLYKKQKEEFRSTNLEKISSPITKGPEFVSPSDEEKQKKKKKPVEEGAAEVTVMETTIENDESTIQNLNAVVEEHKGQVPHQNQLK